MLLNPFGMLIITVHGIIRVLISLPVQTQYDSAQFCVVCTYSLADRHLNTASKVSARLNMANMLAIVHGPTPDVHCLPQKDIRPRENRGICQANQWDSILDTYSMHSVCIISPVLHVPH